jgi:NAD(P)-dependent dehydrogenase (short-subunit alcohol dehydrogenase family)
MTRPTSKAKQAVLVTGASGGIGHAISLAFAAAGWSVGIHYHRNKTAAEDTLTQVVAAGGAGALYEADVREPDAVHQMVEVSCSQVPAPSVFVCNAGIGGSSLILKQQEEDWAEVLATNLTGTFHCLRAMAPPLIDRRDWIARRVPRLNGTSRLCGVKSRLNRIGQECGAGMGIGEHPCESPLAWLAEDGTV